MAESFSSWPCSLRRLMSRYGVPTLIVFVTLGMVMGSEGLGGIDFENYGLTRHIAEIALMIILFSGGFGTAWGVVKRSAPVAGVLSSAGVVITALLVGAFAWLVLDLSILEGFLLGAIISSTDAAAVFTILKTRNLNLRSDIASTPELKADRTTRSRYMLTILFIAALQGTASGFGGALVLQLLVGSLIGVGVGYLGTYVINKIHLSIDGLYFIIAAAIVMLSYGVSSLLEGNGFLAVYLTGMVLEIIR
ncbi:MAG: cation:proton antiporter [Bacillus subtilis]|nr:cation:proton antiporter [Bacillus subtilis]